MLPQTSKLCLFWKAAEVETSFSILLVFFPSSNSLCPLSNFLADSSTRCEISKPTFFFLCLFKSRVSECRLCLPFSLGEEREWRWSSDNQSQVTLLIRNSAEMWAQFLIWFCPYCFSFIGKSLTTFWRFFCFFCNFSRSWGLLFRVKVVAAEPPIKMSNLNRIHTISANRILIKIGFQRIYESLIVHIYRERLSSRQPPM